jgi:hypothetical protein
MAVDAGRSFRSQNIIEPAEMIREPITIGSHLHSELMSPMWTHELIRVASTCRYIFNNTPKV